MSGTLVLLDNAGDSGGTDITGEWQTWDGGPGDFWVWGDLGGGQIDLWAAIDESAPLKVCNSKVTNVTATSSIVVKFNFNHGTKLRAIVTRTNTTSSGINAKVN